MGQHLSREKRQQEVGDGGVKSPRKMSDESDSEGPVQTENLPPRSGRKARDCGVNTDGIPL